MDNQEDAGDFSMREEGGVYQGKDEGDLDEGRLDDRRREPGQRRLKKKPKKRNGGAILAIPGMVLQWFYGTSPFFGVVGGLLMVFGLAQYARRKGRHWAWGLLGMANIVGWVILYFVPPNCRWCGARNSVWAEECEDCKAPMAP
jgi:hypothetical protein